MNSLTHGLPGLGVGYALVLIPLVAALIQRKAASATLWRAPLAAIPCLLIGVLLIAVVKNAGPQPALTAGSWVKEALACVILILTGYAGGIYLTRKAGSQDRHKRGAVIEHTVRTLQPQSGALALAGVQIPALDETKHFKLLGTTGSGKSTAIRGLISGALARGDRAIIADPDGGFLNRFYQPDRGDLILNPFDPRSASWDLFGEIEARYDVEQLARSLIPEGADPAGQEWRGYARTLVAAVLEYCTAEGIHDLAELHRLFAVAEPEELKILLAGTSAQPFFADPTSKMLHSIRGTATPILNALKYTKDHTGKALSIRDWVRKGRGVLFLPYQAGQIAALRELVATWFRLAIFEAMSQPEGDLRLWFVIDELDALGQIDGLKDALARLRKFGGRCVLGLQSIAQMRGTYGDTAAQTIIENCGNTLILRCSASERGGTAEFASRLIGKREVVRKHTSQSRPRGFLSSGRATHTTSDQHLIEDAVMASEIEQLPDLAGFLKLASDPAWKRVELRRD